MDFDAQCCKRDRFLSSRDRHPPNEAATFIENHAEPPGQPAFVFGERSSGYVSADEASQRQKESQEMWKEVDNEKEIVFELLEGVQKKLRRQSDTPEYISAPPVDLRKCDWTQVVEEVQKTARWWKTRPNKQRETRILIDKISRNSAALESWLKLLPGGDYASSICGVFTVAVTAAKQYGKVKEEIYTALAKLPRILDSAKTYVDIYRQIRNQSLERRTFELFRTILTMLRHVLLFFAESKYQKAWASLVKQTQYKEELQQSLEDIQACARDVNEEAAHCQARVMVEVRETSQYQSRIMVDIHDMMRHQVTSRDKYIRSLHKLLLTHPSLRLERSELRDLHTTAQLDVTGYDWVNADCLLPSDDEGISMGKMSKSSNGRRRSLPDPTEVEVKMRRLMKKLQYNPESISQDVSSYLQLGYQLNDRAKARAEAMIRDEKFARFITESSSSTYLLVNGRDDLVSANSISPLAMVLANMFPQEEPQTAPVFTIGYFCAAHNSSPLIYPEAVYNASAISMMASLVCQLLSQLKHRDIPLDLTFLTGSMWKAVKRPGPQILCTILEGLMKQLPWGSAVLCLIDEISWYETRSLRDDTNIVMERLVQLATTEGSNQQIFKLLVTSQNRSLDAFRHFAGHTLDLPESIETSNSAYWAISTVRR